MNKVVESLSKELGLPKSVIRKAYMAYWLFIRTTIEALPLKEELTEEEFRKLRVNFNIMDLGKLVCTYDRYRILNESYKRNLKDDKLKENKTDGQLPAGDI